MALFCGSRLANRQLFANVNKLSGLLNSVNYAQSAAGAPKLNFQSFQEPKLESYDDKNARLKRPMSPHLTIYEIQLTSTLSITHRAAGMMLSGYMAALGIGALVLPHDISYYISIVESMNLSPACIFLAKAFIASPFGFHFANGLRHLYWDTGKGLTLKEVYTTGYSMLALATIITLGLAAL